MCFPNGFRCPLISERHVIITNRHVSTAEIIISTKLLGTCLHIQRCHVQRCKKDGTLMILIENNSAKDFFLEDATTVKSIMHLDKQTTDLE